MCTFPSSPTSRSSLKCSAHDSCGGLLNSEGYCPVCFAPELQWIADTGKVLVGQSAHLHLELSNRSPATAELLVQQVRVRFGSGEWTAVELPWDRVAAGQTKPIRITTPPLATGGHQGIEIVLVLTAAHGFRRETLALSTAFVIQVEANRDLVVQQNIHYAADAPQTGATIYAPVRVQSEAARGPMSGPGSVQILGLHRANRYERQFGIRSADAPEVTAATVVTYRDAPSGIETPSEPFGLRKSQWILGRSRTIEEGGPNDVRLLYRDGQGQIDETASLQISRQHFCLYADEGQLKIRCLSQLGIQVDGQALFPGVEMVLRDGSRIELAADQSRLTLELTFQGSPGHVDRVLIQRRG